MFYSRSSALNLFVLALAFILVFPWVLQDGMFCDGILYAAVSKNLSNGIGTFWHPRMGGYEYITFHEQPPLVFFLQSQFFKLFSPDSIYPERVYCILMLLLSIVLIRRCWNSFFRERIPEQNISFLPVFLYIISPAAIWSYTNNVIEITMVNFVLLAALCMNRFYRHKENYPALLLSGIFIVLASLCKGIQGTFLIAAPFIYWLVYRSHTFGKMLLQSAVVTLPLIIFYSVALSFDHVRVAYELYFKSRFVRTFAGHYDTVPFRLYLFWDLLQILLPSLITAVLVFFAAKRISVSKQLKKDSLFFLLIGMCGIFPLMITKEQRTFYMLTGLPFVMMSLAALISDKANYIIEKISAANAKAIAITSAILLFLTIVIGVFFTAGTYKRDKELLEDVRLAGKMIGKNKFIGASEDVYNDWSVANYLVRYQNIYLETESKAKGMVWYVVHAKEKLPEGYIPQNDTSGYLLIGKKTD